MPQKLGVLYLAPSSTSTSNSTTPTSEPASSSSASNADARWTTVGGVVGGLTGLVLIGGFIAYFVIRRRKRKGKADLEPTATIVHELKSKESRPRKLGSEGQRFELSSEGRDVQPYQRWELGA